MNSITSIGKFLDQPKLINTFEKAVPAILVTGGSGFLLNEVHKAPKEEKRKTFIKTTAVLTGTILTAIFAPKITSKIMKKLKLGHEHTHEHSHHHDGHHGISEHIEEFLSENKVSQKVAEYLNTAKEKILSPKKIKDIYEEVEKLPEGKEFLDEFIPNPEHIDSKHIFKDDLPRLSILGLIPVLGGVLGGIAGDKITEKNWKEKVPNKVKEGSYQYLANIFLCNIGAGAALLAMEKAKIQSKAVRAFGMIGGIILTGIVGGSAIANYIGKTFIDPVFDKKEKEKHQHHHLHGEKLYEERTPEAIDISLHADDIATVAVMSGLKWIVPALPILYSVSGYRAGIGYRNGLKGEKVNG